MPTEPAQLYLALFEFALLLGGVGLLIKLSAPSDRSYWLGSNRLPHWPITPYECVAFIGIIFLTGFSAQLALQLALGKMIAGAADHEALQACVYGFGFQGGGIAGWLIFRSMQKRWYADYGTSAPVASNTGQAGPSIAQSLRHGAVTLLVALPIVTLVSIGWNGLLHALGMPEEPQALIGILANTQSPWVIAGLLFVACVLAPLNEELIFRSGIYRFLRQRGGRGFAVVLSGAMFGAMHFNWAGFLPLAVLGGVLALAYEATGDIRVPIIGHALFNLNTVLIVLSGLSEFGQ